MGFHTSKQPLTIGQPLTPFSVMTTSLPNPPPPSPAHSDSPVEGQREAPHVDQLVLSWGRVAAFPPQLAPRARHRHKTHSRAWVLVSGPALGKSSLALEEGSCCLGEAWI